MSKAKMIYLLLIVFIAGLGVVLLPTVKKYFMPPRVSAMEQYEHNSGGKTVDHVALDRLLHEYVDNGYVNYKGLMDHKKDLQTYLLSLEDIDVKELSRDEILALFINAYNAATIQLILEYYPISSIKDIPKAKRWKDKRWKVADAVYSLDDIENNVLRKRFKEPRIHFAIVCASVGCPPLRPEAYSGVHIERQLQDQAIKFNGSHNYVKWDSGKNTLYLSSIYEWFSGDFENAAGTAGNYALRFMPEKTAAMVRAAGNRMKISYMDYGWNLNGR